MKNTTIYTDLEDCKRENPEYIGKHSSNWKNRTGLTFNSLTILYYCENPKYVIVKCNCGNFKKVLISNVINNKTKTCGYCSNFEDLTGQKFGKLTVLQRSDIQDGNSHTKKWLCQCDCGNTCYTSPKNLKAGLTKSCGCITKNRMKILGIEQSKKNIKNLTGQKFGLLTAVYPTDKRSGTHVIWACLCDCGNVHLVSSNNLLRQQVTSCGCRNSKNEGIIQNYLQQLKKIFESRYYIYFNSHKMFFDFFVNNSYFIEYDGEQHFKGYSNKQSYNLIHKRDLIKNKYCFDNNIPLIRIPYDAEYTIDDLKLETTRFLLTSENEKEYYESRL